MEAEVKLDVADIYQKLLSYFGKQEWWPAETRFEVIIGAILTQQTTWQNVESAIRNLKCKGLLEPHSLAKAASEDVEALIRNTGFYRQKSRRIISFSKYLVTKYDGYLDEFFNKSKDQIREELLSLEGIGLETADSILLYAADRLTFPIDNYTKRLCERMGLKKLEYEALRRFFENNLPRELEIYKELHALLVKLGKAYCRTKPQCSACPLRDGCIYPNKS